MDKQAIWKYLNFLVDVHGLPQMWADIIRMGIDNILTAQEGEEERRQFVQDWARDRTKAINSTHYIDDTAQEGEEDDLPWHKCECDICNKRRNQVAKRKIEEYCRKTPYKERSLLNCLNWLDKDEE